MKVLKKMNKQKGFTLIELIVVIAVIAILAAILLPRFIGFSDSAKQKAVLSDARNYAVASQALAAEGDTTITSGEIIAYTGRDAGGTFTVQATGSFTLAKNGYTASYDVTTGLVTVTP